MLSKALISLSIFSVGVLATGAVLANQARADETMGFDIPGLPEITVSSPNDVAPVLSEVVANWLPLWVLRPCSSLRVRRAPSSSKSVLCPPNFPRSSPPSAARLSCRCPPSAVPMLSPSPRALVRGHAPRRSDFHGRCGRCDQQEWCTRVF
ncbi:hypothetical protein LXA43DRAFT_369847 [Ganoderma leucocontextum]|nr:hypothetical protein LXA43DRAFT_369847 [Ganoderma leucocontextum]